MRINPFLQKPAEEIVEQMMRLQHIPDGRPCHCGYMSPDAVEMPKHRLQVCSRVTALLQRERCAKVFKSWGTPQEIAAAMGSALTQSPAKPSVFFPSPPERQNQSPSDDQQ